MPVTTADDEIGDIFGFPSYESFRAGQLTTPEPSPSRRPEVPLNIGFGAGGGPDFATFNAGAAAPDLSFNYAMPGFGFTDFFLTPGTGGSAGGGLLSGLIGGGTPTILDKFTSGVGVGDLGLLTSDPKAPNLGPQVPFQLDPTGGEAGIITVPRMVVRPEGPAEPANLTLLGWNVDSGAVATNTNVGNLGGPVTLPQVVVGPQGPVEPSANTLVGYNPNQVITASEGLNAGATGPVALPQVTVRPSGPTEPSTPSLTGYNPNQLIAGANGLPVVLPEVKVRPEGPNEPTTPSVTGYNPKQVITGFTGSPGEMMGPVVLPKVKVNVNTEPEVKVDTSLPKVTNTNPLITGFTGPIGEMMGPYVLPKFKVNEKTDPEIKVDTSLPKVKQNFETDIKTSIDLDKKKEETKKDDTKIDLGTGQNVGNVGSNTSTSTSTGSTKTVSRRNIGAELAETMAALKANEPAITGMYKGLYESFMPDTLRTAATSGLSQLRADEEKLARLRAGILSPEDIRTAQQGAREAYAARGQVMGPGAVGAEILNRENIRQAREDNARAAYNQSIGNILNTANLQTGNIFQPIGNLISGTFNPLGSYPADVYGTNVNADIATMIADKNYAAAVESARLAGAAGKSASTTSALGDIFGAVLPSIFKALPFCWVAREVYGAHNPKWLKFRTWMFTQAPGWFFRWYMNNGERFAEWLRRNPWMKPAIRFWMDSRIRSMENQITLKEAF